MHIQKISIRNFLGIEELDITPGGFTTITGPNGTGKTSVLESIKEGLSSGHDATLLRNGAEKGEVVFVLDDGMSITKRVNADTSSTEVRGADGKKMARPAEAIAGLLDMMSVNPLDFLTAKKKDRVKVLLESMPLELDIGKLGELSGIEVTAQPGVHALHVIELVTKQVFDARTGTNRAVKEKDATIKQLREAMPDQADGVTGSEDEIVDQVQAATTTRDTTLGKIAAKLSGIEATARADINALRDKLQADIDALKAAAQQQVDAINAGVAENTAKANAAKEAANTKHTAATAPLAAALVAIRQNRELTAKRETTQALIETMTGELEDLRAEADAQTASLTAIESYKSELLDSLPIPGLEVRDGEIFRHDVPFDRLNTAQQVDVAVEIAKLRAGSLGVCCVDGLELLDSDSFEAFRESALASGLQLFVTRVGDDEFAVSTQD